MQLQALLSGFVDTSHDFTITGLCLDSRQITEGQVFVALAAADQSALMNVQQAVARGARAVIYDPKDVDLSNWIVAAQGKNNTVNSGVFLAIPALDTQLGAIAARYYAQPSSKLDVIGITGTNGKTSCTQFLGQLLDACGIIGTLGWGVWGDLTFTGYTTPDALATQTMLAAFVGQGQRTVAMEVSSHGIAEGRINSVRFKGVVLTNISRDHLDFHGTMAAYIATKQVLFTRTDTEFAVFNLDDALSGQFMAVVPQSIAIWGFGIIKDANTAFDQTTFVARKQFVYAQHIRHQADGLAFEIGWQDQLQTLQVPLYGDFNVENILAVVTVLLALGESLATIAAKLQMLKPVNGRMQRFGNPQSALIFVDYAHTPDALEKALISARQHCKKALWVVFGCGGDRDTGKRPQMGACAAQYADHVIITDDNPRSEDPASITQAIVAGFQRQSTLNAAHLSVIHDREHAIQTAIGQAAIDDCIVIAGKGHEQYQEINGQKLPFSDAQVVIKLLADTAVA
ncbi:MAG: UDP-N-acetylmuramoyl-L-alanyl-D-glutamate--2,6-diaminopimelate ligase [Methylococcaceae bacterium]|nr:UDP-N-acetylmuramoyl-L-alanyl-D-glutamate--2,6-diaminopimelate ligase [Methylococcaceae bacterium]